MVYSESNPGYFGSISEAQLSELRKMLLGLDTEDLRRLTTLVNDPEVFSEEISELLPNSIKIMLKNGKISYKDLTPVIEKTLKDSIRKNPESLANILFPIMLPAVRKAVSEDIRNMINSLNTTLEHGFSPKRIGWRFKALFSGMSYAEIVLSNAYVFRVKQVFLIHKQTGLLLQSVVSNDESVTKDADMISSMLTAIKDFVQDSFDVDQNNELDTIKVGKFNIWIEQGPDAIVAAIVDGDAFTGLRNELKDTIEKIHLKYSYYLEKFDGETSMFENTKPFLEKCLLSESKKKKDRKPVFLIAILLILLGLLGYWIYNFTDNFIRINRLEKSLKTIPGIIITEKSKENGKVVFYGLKDPLATKEYNLLPKFDLDTSKIKFCLKPYISLEKDLILKRCYNILKPPKTITFFLNDENELIAKGSSNKIWLNNAFNLWVNIPGLRGFDTTNYTLIDVNHTELQKSFLSIEEYFFIFKYNKVELSQEQKIRFKSLIEEVNTVLSFNFKQDSIPVIEVIGHTSYEGNKDANKIVAFERAQQFINLMIEAGIPMEVLVPKTDFIEENSNRYPIRSVSFKVIYVKPEDL